MQQQTTNKNLALLRSLVQEKNWDKAQEVLQQEFERELTAEERGDIWIELTTVQIAVDNAIMRAKVSQMEETVEALNALQTGGNALKDKLQLEQTRESLH